MTRPKEILAPNAAALAILWDDGHESFYPGPMLRKLCPCAECNDKPGGSLTLVHGGEDPRHKIRSFHPIGNYALGIAWGDGHKTGIYTFDHLRSICSCPACKGRGGSS